MARYRARIQLLVGTEHVKAGEEFLSDEPPGRNWEPLDDDARARVIALFGALGDSRPYDVWHDRFSAVR